MLSLLYERSMGAVRKVNDFDLRNGGADMKKLFEVQTKAEKFLTVCGGTSDVSMIMFSGTASGEYFNGKVLGTGVDTQKVPKDGIGYLSARYMLEGTDINGEKCKLFVENNGTMEDGFRPLIVTDSKALSWLETTELSAEIVGSESGVRVSVFADIKE